MDDMGVQLTDPWQQQHRQQPSSFDDRVSPGQSSLTSPAINSSSYFYRRPSATPSNMSNTSQLSRESLEQAALKASTHISNRSISAAIQNHGMSSVVSFDPRKELELAATGATVTAIGHARIRQGSREGGVATMVAQKDIDAQVTVNEESYVQWEDDDAEIEGDRRSSKSMDTDDEWRPQEKKWVEDLDVGARGGPIDGIVLAHSTLSTTVPTHEGNEEIVASGMALVTDTTVSDKAALQRELRDRGYAHLIKHMTSAQSPMQSPVQSPLHEQQQQQQQPNILSPAVHKIRRFRLFKR